MKLIVSLLIIGLVLGCQESNDKPDKTVVVSDTSIQTEIFNKLVQLSGANSITDNLDDSLAFLILPLKLSCAACRKKTIDSIVSRQNDIARHHYIIISSSSGIKNIRSYFLEEDTDLPAISTKLFLDSSNMAYKLSLVKDNPAIYYTANRKAYKKILAIPATIKADLREFFSGVREENKLAEKK